MSYSQSPELRVLLERGRAGLVRAVVREARLSEGVSPAISGLIADDTAQIWQALCRLGSGSDRVRLEILCSRKDVRSRLTLPGHARFSKIADCLSGRMRADAGISWRERGIDGWEVAIHRSLLGELPPAEAMAEEPSSAAATGNSCAYEIDVPQREDAPAIARCFLAVYGHAYVHPEVFSPHHYWDKVERGELIPVVARDGQGEIVGHLALERGPGTQVAERGEAVVLPAHRSHGLLERMTERHSEEAVKHDLQGIYAEPVMIHTYSQRNDERAGMPVCAVLLGVNPESFHPKDTPCIAGQRQSYLRTFRFIKPPASRVIYAPKPYREMLNNIYASLGVPLSDAAGNRYPPPHSQTSMNVNGRGYGVIAFERIGEQAAIELGQAFRDVCEMGA